MINTLLWLKCWLHSVKQGHLISLPSLLSCIVRQGKSHVIQEHCGFFLEVEEREALLCGLLQLCLLTKCFPRGGRAGPLSPKTNGTRILHPEQQMREPPWPINLNRRGSKYGGWRVGGTLCSGRGWRALGEMTFILWLEGLCQADLLGKTETL